MTILYPKQVRIRRQNRAIRKKFDFTKFAAAACRELPVSDGIVALWVNGLRTEDVWLFQSVLPRSAGRNTMAVYLCQCNLVVSTAGQNASCPRCGRALQLCERLFLSDSTENPARRETGGGGDATHVASAETDGRKRPCGLSGFFSAIAHIRSEQHINFSSSPSS